MKSILVQLESPVYDAITRLAGKGHRGEFIREAVRKAVRDAELERMRKAYQDQPDSEAEADAWANPEDFAGGNNTTFGGPICPRPRAGGRFCS